MTISDQPVPGEAITIWRGWLIATGVLLIGFGGLTFVSEVSPDQYPGVVAWLVGALVVHDGLGAMVVLGVTVIARRTARIVPFVALAIVQAALAVLVIVTVLVLPEIVKSRIGTANPSVLPQDYLQNLAIFSIGVAAVTAAALLIALVLSRARQRSSGTG